MAPKVRYSEQVKAMAAAAEVVPRLSESTADLSHDARLLVKRAALALLRAWEPAEDAQP